ncbi:MAG TPA: GDP-mannose 4,6-dehydratase [Candidatus Acidoferrales bacterium]|nr:GDP-mannose 4,6-dehydratase [Candidatus Acidoferrales bacterium]
MRALLTGVTGQDGSYLAELLLEKGYEVYGTVRNIARANRESASASGGRVNYIEADLTDQTSLDRAMEQVKPDEVYNLAGQTFVPVSWIQPLLTMEVTGMGALRMLEAIRRHAPGARFLQVSSSEIFGKSEGTQQSEGTRLRPRNPYGAAKMFAHHITINYRESYGMFACSCIAFNHESPRRAPEFVTRKVSRQVARIKLGLADKVKMGNIEGRRDWGFAGDYVHAMWLMLQQPTPQDFVIATGVTHSVKELLKIAFSHVGLDWQKHVEIDSALLRPAEDDPLTGDTSKANKILGWKPTMSFDDLVRMMVDSDLSLLSKPAALASKTILGGD